MLVGEPGSIACASLTSHPDARHGAGGAGRAHGPLLPAENRLLQTAAVIGTEVPLPLLQAIAELPEGACTRSCPPPGRRVPLRDPPLSRARYTFKHALTHEVAYGSLLQERRWGLHARLSRPEALAAERVAEQVERLAHDALRGEVWGEAPPYCQQAGARALDHAAFREAAAAFEQGLQALAHLPEPGDTGWAGPRAPPRGWEARRATGRVWAVPAPCRAMPRPWPGQSMIGPDWDGCWLGCPVYPGLMGDDDGAMARAGRPSNLRPSSATAPCR